MLKIDDAPDLNGRSLLRGDTVTTVGGGTTGKIKDIVSEEGALFVEVRPIYQSAGKGVWHAADRVLWLSRPKPKLAKPNESTPSPRKAGRGSAKTVAKSSMVKK
jgi:hypothetical protein